MNEIAERYITSKELAEIFDVSVRTINETIQKMNLAGTFQVTVKNGVTTKLTEAQATLLKQEIAQHHNLQSRQIDSVTTELEENQKIVEVIQILQRRNNDLTLRVENAEKEVEKLLPAANFAYQLCSSKDTIDIGECAKVLNRNIGRNNLFEFLRNKGVLQGNNIPYQKYIDAGYFRVIESKYVTPLGETKISLKTVVFQKGVAYINTLLAKESA